MHLNRMVRLSSWVCILSLTCIIAPTLAEKPVNKTSIKTAPIYQKPGARVRLIPNERSELAVGATRTERFTFSAPSTSGLMSVTVNVDTDYLRADNIQSNYLFNLADEQPIIELELTSLKTGYGAVRFFIEHDGLTRALTTEIHLGTKEALNEMNKQKASLKLLKHTGVKILPAEETIEEK